MDDYAKQNTAKHQDWKNKKHLKKLGRTKPLEKKISGKGLALGSRVGLKGEIGVSAVGCLGTLRATHHHLDIRTFGRGSAKPCSRSRESEARGLSCLAPTVATTTRKARGDASVLYQQPRSRPRSTTTHLPFNSFPLHRNAPNQQLQRLA